MKGKGGGQMGAGKKDGLDEKNWSKGWECRPVQRNKWQRETQQVGQTGPGVDFQSGREGIRSARNEQQA